MPCVSWTPIYRGPHPGPYLLSPLSNPRFAPHLSSLLVAPPTDQVFAAVPIEMCRPWQWSTILSLGYCLDRRKVTRRALCTVSTPLPHLSLSLALVGHR